LKIHALNIKEFLTSPPKKSRGKRELPKGSRYSKM
jgi:hypothetical protein